jgi:hypothetical protein
LTPPHLVKERCGLGLQDAVQGLRGTEEQIGAGPIIRSGQDETDLETDTEALSH